jgi:hypothetical protein
MISRAAPLAAPFAANIGRLYFLSVASHISSFMVLWLSVAVFLPSDVCVSFPIASFFPFASLFPYASSFLTVATLTQLEIFESHGLLGVSLSLCNGVTVSRWWCLRFPLAVTWSPVRCGFILRLWLASYASLCGGAFVSEVTHYPIAVA